MRKNTLLILLLSFCTIKFLTAQDTQKAGCSEGSTQAVMQYNNIRALYSTQGIFWENTSTMNGGYEVPWGSGLSTIYSGALWIGGYDPNGQVKVAADLYGGGGSDYWPGPLDEVTGDITSNSCSDFDRFWGVSQSEINLFLANGTISSDILNWPGKNNPNLSYLPLNQDLAPFVDVNVDGNYDPDDGDYPAIKGDTAIWWVLNDKGNVHTSSGSAAGLGVELHIMAYAFATNDDINDMTFYDVDIINKSTFTYNNTHLGIFMDPDIGGYADDYVGCDTTWSVGYAYNGDNIDEDGYGANPPTQAVTMIKKPIINGQVVSMSSFISFGAGGISAMGDPSLPLDYYNYMKGIWKDGSQLVYGGNGHNSTGGTQPFSYQYNGLPSSSSEWSECSEGNMPGDRKFVLSFGSFDFNPSNKISMSFALVYHRPTSGSNCDGINGLITSVQHAHNFYNTIPTNLKEAVEQELNVKCFPNPASNFLNISLGKNMKGNVILKLYDMQGKLALIETKQTQDVIKMNISSMLSGNYILKIITDNGLMATYKIAIEK